MLDESKKSDDVLSDVSEDLIQNPEKEKGIEIFCKYITKNGKKIYPKNGKFFHFFI